jgi:hypothetical protein
MTVFIHVGLPKAASTTIQYFLSSNVDTLARAGIQYPKLAIDRKSSYGTNPGTHNCLAVELRRGAPGPAWTRLRDLLAEDAGRSRFVLSSEALSSAEPSVVRAALPQDCEAQIIFYVRDSHSTIVSRYAQLTKTGANVHDFDAFFQERFSTGYLDWAAGVSKWAAVFGADKIHVRFLDKKHLVGGDVRKDVLSVLGQGESPALGELTFTPDRNVTPGWKVIEIVRSLNASLWAKMSASLDKATLNELQSARRQRRESPVHNFMMQQWRPASKIGRELGLLERGEYVSEAQFQHANDQFDRQLDVLRASGVKSDLVSFDRSSFVPRSFLPTVQEVPAAEVSEFLLRLVPSGYWNLLSRETVSGGPAGVAFRDED